jgi:calcineurin-like phosphoesterase family protein
MRKIFVVSDTHFNHGNILKFTGNDGEYIRRFDSVTDMNECMISRWNEAVHDGDIVYHLGDVYFKNAEAAGNILRRLNGRKRLVLGNHDNGKCPVLQEHFQKISSSRQFREYGVILSHIPIVIPGGKWTWNIHGHIHQNPSPTLRHVNVSVEAVDYTPVDIEELYERMR